MTDSKDLSDPQTVKPNVPIYMDCHATTPVDPRVLEAMLPYFTEIFGNPASNTHCYGWEAAAAVKRSRQLVAEAIGAIPEEIVWTSGATEANNLAIKGVAEAYCDRGRHLVTVATEHNAVLDPCRYLGSLGFDITYLSVQENGLIDLDAFEVALRPETILVSVMVANNEIGVLQPIAEIGARCRERGILFHTDAAQAIGKLPLHVERDCIDLMSMTAHKLYGPKGIGALYVRRRDPRVRLAPQLHGGGHERGRRSGTLYVPQIVGFAKALEIALGDRDVENKRVRELRDRLWEGLCPDNSNLKTFLNGDRRHRLPGNLNVSFGNVDGDVLLVALQPIVAVSSGSACTAEHPEPSHVLLALGRSKALAASAIRFGIGRWTTPEQIDFVIRSTVAIASSLEGGKLSA